MEKNKNKVGAPKQPLMNRTSTRYLGVKNHILKRYSREYKGNDLDVLDAGWKVLAERIHFWIKNELENE